MRLNPECIRDIMLFCVDHTLVRDEYRVDDKDKICYAKFHILQVDAMILYEPLSKYPFGELTYHVIQLSEGGFLATDFTLDTKDRKEEFLAPAVYYVTPKGYDFVAATSEKKQWEKAKSILSKAGSISLSVLEQVAIGLATATVNQLMGKG